MKNILNYRFPLLLLVLLLSYNPALRADPVNLETATQVGQHFIESTRKGPGLSENMSLTLVYGGESSSTLADLFYVFNVNGNAGFVIVAADDEVQPVLGYSVEGAFDPNHIPEALDRWLMGYREEIFYIRSNDLKANDQIRTKWAELKQGVPDTPETTSSVAPLIQTKWNQNPNENMFCPGGSVTGCVATAMAQVMNYWQHPAQGRGTHSYLETGSTTTPSYGTLSADFGATVYQWGLMPLQPTSPNQWISTLMLHCGVSTDMNYSPQGSGTPTSNVANALTKYFKYDPNTVIFVEKSSYSGAKWVSLLKQELDAFRPMQYRGTGSGGGHSFVCDGYDNNDMFHFNWGWGGSSDGYFAVNALNPGSLGTGGGSGGFNSGQGAVIGIKPDPNIEAELQMLTPPYLPIPEPTYGQLITVSAEFANSGSQFFTGDVTLGMYNAVDGKLLSIREDLAQSFTNIGSVGASTAFVFPANFPPGSYFAKVMYRNAGVSEWTPVGTAAFPNDGGFVVYGVSPLYLTGTPTQVFTNPVQQNKPFQVAAYFINLSPTTYSGKLSVDLHRMDGSWIKSLDETNVNINPVTSFNWTFNFPSGISEPPGTYKLVFWEKTNGSFDRMVSVPADYPTVDYLELIPAPLQPDVYEPNNEVATATTMPLNFIGNAAFVNTSGANNTGSDDEDYYRIDFTYHPDYMYRVRGRLYDLKNNNNNGSLTNDCIWAFKNVGYTWSPPYDDDLLATGGEFFVRSGEVLFYVRPYFAGTSGTYYLDLEIDRIPAFDLPCGAINLPVDGQPQTGFSNVNASPNYYNEPGIPVAGDCNTQWCEAEAEPRLSHSVWFTFQAPASGAVEISTCGLADFDTQLALYQTNNCNNLIGYGLLAANDDGDGCDNYTSKLSITGLTSGQTYYVLVDGYEAATGNLGIRITDLTSPVKYIGNTPDMLSISPNPTSGALNILLKGEGAIASLILSDIEGKILLSRQTDDHAQSAGIDLSGLPAGVYLLQVRTDERTYTRKILVQK